MSLPYLSVHMEGLKLETLREQATTQAMWPQNKLLRQWGLERSAIGAPGREISRPQRRARLSSSVPVVVARLFRPEEFDPSKLTVSFQAQGQLFNARNGLPDLERFLPRKYTLTHSDFFGELLLSIGSSYDEQQLEGWYTRLMRDEIIAEWQAKGRLSLHVHCHVSGGHCLLAPAALRYGIFQREMPLVLQAIRYGDDRMISEHPEFDKSTVWVHYHSDDPEFSRADCWGPLFSAANGFTNFHRQAAIPHKLLAFM